MQEWSPVTENDDEQLVSFRRFAPAGVTPRVSSPSPTNGKAISDVFNTSRESRLMGPRNGWNPYSTLLEIIVAHEAKQSSGNVGDVKEISSMNYFLFDIFILTSFFISSSLNVASISSGTHRTKCNQKKEECAFLRVLYKMFVILRSPVRHV